MNGTVVSVQVNTLTVSVGGVNYTVQFQNGGLVTLNGVTCMLSDLKAGDAVNMTIANQPENLPFASVIAATR